MGVAVNGFLNDRTDSASANDPFHDTPICISEGNAHSNRVGTAIQENTAISVKEASEIGRLRSGQNGALLPVAVSGFASADTRAEYLFIRGIVAA